MLKLSRIAPCALAVAATLPVFAGQHKGPPPQLYTLERVSPPEGFRALAIQAVNQRGEIAGVLSDDWIPHKTVFFRDADGTMKRVAAPPGCTKQQVQGAAAFNNRHEMMVHTSAACGPNWFWSPGTGWIAITLSAEFTGTVARAMNGAGDVVGTTNTLIDGQQVAEGFVWHGDGTYTTYQMDGGVGFYGINDKGEVAATIRHVPDPTDPDDVGGITAALLKTGEDPVYTGDFFHQDTDRGVTSSAVGINQKGSIALDSVFHLDGQNNSGTTCEWHQGREMRCATRPQRNLYGVGIDGDGNVFYTTGGGSALNVGRRAHLYRRQEREVHGASVLDPESSRQLVNAPAARTSLRRRAMISSSTRFSSFDGPDSLRSFAKIFSQRARSASDQCSTVRLASASQCWSESTLTWTWSRRPCARLAT
jgi:hypothetical protein